MDPNRRTFLHLFFFLSFLYLLTTPGHFYTVDSVVSYQTTVSLVTQGSLEIPGNIITVTDAEGKPTGRYGLLQMVLCVPLYLVGALLERISGTPAFLYESWPVTLVATFNQWISALGLVIFYKILVSLGYDKRTSFVATLVLGFASPWWTYSRDLFRQPLAGFLFLWAVYEALRFRETQRTSNVVRFGTAVGLSVTNRITAVVAWPGIVWLFLSGVWKGNRKLLLRTVILLGLVVAIGIVLQILVNLWRFHHWWGNAYQNRIFKLSYLTRNIPDLLLSPARGLFLFCPPLLLVGHGFIATWRKDRALAVAVFLMVMAKLILFGTYYDYTGGMNPGPRYLIPILPILFIPVGILICSEWSNRSLRYSVYGLTALGVIINGYNSLTAYPYTATFWEQVLIFLGVGSYAPTAQEWNPLSEIPPWDPRVVFHDVLAAKWLLDGHYLSLGLFLLMVCAGLAWTGFRLRSLFREPQSSL